VLTAFPQVRWAAKPSTVEPPHFPLWASSGAERELLEGVEESKVVDAGRRRTSNCVVVPMVAVAMDQQVPWSGDRGLGYSRHGLVP